MTRMQCLAVIGFALLISTGCEREPTSSLESRPPDSGPANPDPGIVIKPELEVSEPFDVVSIRIENTTNVTIYLWDHCYPEVEVWRDTRWAGFDTVCNGEAGVVEIRPGAIVLTGRRAFDSGTYRAMVSLAHTPDGRLQQFCSTNWVVK